MKTGLFRSHFGVGRAGARDDGRMQRVGHGFWTCLNVMFPARGACLTPDGRIARTDRAAWPLIDATVHRPAATLEPWAQGATY